jgi:outer membrane protein OmpU
VTSGPIIDVRQRDRISLRLWFRNLQRTFSKGLRVIGTVETRWRNKRARIAKRALFCSTTLLSATGLTDAAHAEFDVTIGGTWNTAYGFVQQDDGDGDAGDSRHNTAINQDWELNFRALQVLDNGISVGGRLELEGATASDQVDERWMYFRGGFGEIRVGDEDDARKLMSYTAPDPTNFLFGVNSPSFTYLSLGAGQVVTTNSTTPFDGDSAKLIYFTPTFSGFQLAVSYAPESTQDRGGAGTGGTDDLGQVSNLWSVGANWSGEFSGFTLGFGGGYSVASSETGGPDPWIGAFGVNMGFASVRFGGSVAVARDTDEIGYNGYPVNEATVFDLGVTYGFDQVVLGIGWSRGEYEDTADGGEDTLDYVNLGGSYNLGPGVLLAAFVGWFSYEDGGPASNDNGGWQTGVGASLDF